MVHVLVLALDTSSPSGSLAVLRDEKVIGVVSTATGEVYSSRMFRELDFLLGELSLRMEEFELFAVAAGPGSFTGLRVGLAAVKGWAEVYRKPIAAVSALEAVAVQAHSNAELIAPVLDARRGQLYFGLYRRAAGGAPGESRLVLDGEEYVLTPAEFFEVLSKRAAGTEFMVVAPQPELFSGAALQNETAALIGAVEPASSVLAPFIGQLGFRRAQRGELADPLTLDANYVRRTDAELQWKKK
ncbi:MAG TPA: tRNA (adenosine(37)-N6)-threonylcarbamoyltransferase complex dimerization subunit type 1 TsaB [Candidatus Dormibacteraeota bacterium]|nr:tRNA (adenosine(37)-N6)-threonylcarbamoyltransferase complex dimerization subunit type 1 TsaB [Candidatus Dormibacteraeota bacterium]